MPLPCTSFHLVNLLLFLLGGHIKHSYICVMFGGLTFILGWKYTSGTTSMIHFASFKWSCICSYWLLDNTVMRCVAGWVHRGPQRIASGVWTLQLFFSLLFRDKWRKTLWKGRVCYWKSWKFHCCYVRLEGIPSFCWHLWAIIFTSEASSEKAFQKQCQKGNMGSLTGLHTNYTRESFNSSSLKSWPPKRKGLSSNHHFQMLVFRESIPTSTCILLLLLLLLGPCPPSTLGIPSKLLGNKSHRITFPPLVLDITPVSRVITPVTRLFSAIHKGLSLHL